MLYEHPYAALLARLKSLDLTLGPVSTPAGRRTVLLRHDVEFDIRAAVGMAEIENARGVKATYLIAIRSPFFNVLEADVSHAIRRIAKLGHELGLHFIGSLDEPQLPERVDSDLRLASVILGVGELQLVSYHTPGSLERLKELVPTTHRSIYLNILDGEQTYVSDSGGTWQGGLEEAVENPLSRGIHLLTHPHWWRSVAEAPYARLCELTALASHMGPDPRLKTFTPGLWRSAAQI